MNDSAASPIVPPPLHQAIPPSTPLGEHPEDRVPIVGVVSGMEAILRHPRRVVFQLREGNAGKMASALFMVTLISGLVYGLVVGTFSGGSQLWMAPVKIFGGLLISALICLPSLYIFSCLSGSRARLGEVGGLVLGLIALTTILLIGFAPVAWVFSQSTSSVALMGVLHLAFWGLATIFGWRFLRNGFAHLSVNSHGALYLWMLIFVLVCLQMTTALRPILGTGDTFFPREKKFFAAHWMDVLEQSGRPPATTQPR
jgi:hypothetical protein